MGVLFLLFGYVLIGIASSLVLVGIQKVLDRLDIDSWWFCSEKEFLGANIIGWPISFSLAIGSLFLAGLSAAFKYAGCIFKAIAVRENSLGILKQANKYFNKPDNGMSMFCP